MPLKNFLSLILPQQGYKCWVEINSHKKVTQGFVPTIEELAVKLQDIDARGHDAYFACASFVTAHNRRAANAGWLNAFFTDIDAGEGKPYATADDAISACDEFCSRAGLPLPGIVRSGAGAHAYWVLDHTMSREEWLPVAQRFKLLTNILGFQCDPSRTADIASILRPPGTKNYKLPASPRRVEIDDPSYFVPTPYEDFIASVIKNTDGVAAEKIKTASINANFSSGIQAGKAFDATKGLVEGGRNVACARYAGELVAKGYPEDEVLRLCTQWNELNTPPMPLQEVHTTVASIIRRHKEQHPVAAVAAPIATTVQEPATMPDLPHGYRWGNAGQLMVKVEVTLEDGKKEFDWKILSHLPVFLASWMNEEGYKTKNSYLFNHFHPTRGWLQFAMNAKEFNGSEWYGSWAENGCSIADGMDKAFKTYVRRAENMMRATGKELTRYTQFGWKDDDKAFLVGNSLCHADGRVEKVVGTDKLTPLMNAMKPVQGGSQEAWTRAANKLATPGMELHLFMLLSSFAAPLMKFCVDEGNGGSILSVISEESGQGKTPMAAAIASVWGDLAGTVTTGNFTENSRIEQLVRHCHLPQVQEEMAYNDPLVASQGVEKFTSGTDRGRLNQAGASSGLPERYQTILISLSNKSLYELVKMVNVPMSRRIFEIEAERPSKEDLANLGGMSREMLRNAGHVGVQFIRLLVAPEVVAYVKQHLSGSNDGAVGTVQQKYRERLASRPEDRFIVWHLSAVEVAATILNHYGLLQFDVNRIMQWAEAQAAFRIYDPQGEEPALKLNVFINSHIDNCLTVAGPYTPRSGPLVPQRVPSRRLAMRLEMRSQRLYIEHDFIHNWCTKNNISFNNLGRQLTKLGVVLERSKLVTLGAGTEIASGRVLCWEVDMAHPSISGQLRLDVTAVGGEAAQA